ncbi:hypothetical protein EfmJHP9_13870 [Enterococcus faecium]|nr:hypothetical protein EfmJHP9_13870 [Enterococcus faecium]
MYYPYLRGKQFDLLALKEALSRGLLSNKIQPVIEPVRDSATLKNVILDFVPIWSEALCRYLHRFSACMG